MQDVTPDASTLDAIEVATCERFSALQLDRTRRSLQHAYEPHYRRAFDAACVAPADLLTLDDRPHSR